MKIRTLLLVFLMAFTAGCTEYIDYTDYTDDDITNGWTEALVVNMGDPKVDGCGWMIKINGEHYYPVNLDDEYRKEALPVRIRYTYDPVEFRCGRGGVRYPSIRITQIEVDAPALLIMTEGDWDGLPDDGFRMDSAYVEGDFLYLHVSYSGGCRKHEFNLWKLPPGNLDNPRVELMLSHDSNGDSCEAWVSEWLVFSLEPLRKRDHHRIKFYLRGSPEMSAYFGEYTYWY